MKQKIQKKLLLSKITVADLDKETQDKVRAGISGWVCPETYVCATRLCTNYNATCTEPTFSPQCYKNTLGEWTICQDPL